MQHLAVFRERDSPRGATTQRLAVRRDRQVLAKLGEGTVQATLDGRRADPNALGHLLGMQTLDIAQYQYRSVRRLNALNPRMELMPDLGRFSLLVKIWTLGLNLRLLAGGELLKGLLPLRSELALAPLLDADASGDSEQPSGQ
jgi:hypothetical protein